MTDFQPGEIVDITIKGARVIEYEASGFLTYEADEIHHEVVPGGSVAVERVAPAEWPPRAGDLWRDRDGDLWYGLLDDNDDELLIVLSPGRTSKHPAFVDSGNDAIRRNHGPLILVYREEATS